MGATDKTEKGFFTENRPAQGAPPPDRASRPSSRVPNGGEATLMGSEGDWPVTVPMQDLSQDPVIQRAPRTTVRGQSAPCLGGIALLARLGKGGMGSVYYGYHPRLEIEVAVKVLPLNLAEQHPDMIQRFFREAQVAARVKSPNLVSVLDVNQEEGVFYIVMEFVNGGSAGDYLKEAKARGETGIPEAEALEITIASATGLAAAHAKGIIHRDIKPVNIMIPKREGGEGLDFTLAKLCDLGLARPEHVDQTLTQAQVVMGTLGYMAPEQAEDAAQAGKPADVFGLGATLYALLAGTPPFTGSTPSRTLIATVQQPHPPVTRYRPDVTPATVQLLDCCLAKRPEARFADGAEMLRELLGLREFLTQGADSRVGVLQDLGHSTIVPVDTGQTAVVPGKRTPPGVPAGVQRRPGEGVARRMREAQQAEADVALAAEEQRKAQEAEEARRAEEARKSQESEARQNLNVALMFALEAKNAGDWGQVDGLLGQALEQLGDLEHPNRAAAAALLTQARDASAKQAQLPAKLQEAEALLAAQRYESARRAFEELRAFFPRAAELARIESGRASALAGLNLQTNVAAPILENLAVSQLHSKEERYRDALQAGQAALVKGAWDEAEEVFQLALRLKPESQSAADGLRLVQESRAQDQYAQSLSEAQRLLAEQPQSPEGRYLNLDAPVREAVDAALRRALECRPEDPAALQLQSRLGWPLWDGQGSLWEYARRVGLKHTERLDLGNFIKLDLVLVPPGAFLMGSPDQEAGRDAQERLHEVVIRQPFLMGRYPVGQAEYEQVMGHNPSHFKGDRLPVENVTWQEASEFCKRVSVRTKRAVRLPTEAEWEYACRATTRSRFCAGDYDLDLERVAWFRGTSGNTTHAVGDKEANLFGLGDMHGNVAEWCQDWFAENYYAQSPASDPPGPPNGNSRVVRGGNWSSAPASCRSAARDRYRPVNRYDVVGFRVVVTL